MRLSLQANLYVHDLTTCDQAKETEDVVCMGMASDLIVPQLQDGRYNTIPTIRREREKVNGIAIFVRT